MATGKFLGSLSLNMSSFSRNPGFGGRRFLIPQSGTYRKVPTCPDCRFSSVTLKNITKPYCYLEVPDVCVAGTYSPMRRLSCIHSGSYTVKHEGFSIGEDQLISSGCFCSGASCGGPAALFRTRCSVGGPAALCRTHCSLEDPLLCGRTCCSGASCGGCPVSQRSIPLFSPEVQTVARSCLPLIR